MGDQGIETLEKPKYTEFHTNVPKDPLNWVGVFYRSAGILGYKIGFEDGASDMLGNMRSDSLRVMVSDKAERIKLGSLLEINKTFNQSFLFQLVDKRRFSDIRDLINGNEDGVYETSPVKIKKELDPRLLEEAYMQAYLRGEDIKYLRQTDDKKLYDELAEKGVLPITPEAEMIITVNNLKEILKEHPELAPDNYQE